MDKIHFSDLLIDMTIIETIAGDVTLEWRCDMTESDSQLLLPYIALQAQEILQMFRSSCWRMRSESLSKKGERSIQPPEVVI